LVDQHFETERTGVFACGNVTAVFDLADHVSASGQRAGRAAAERALGKKRGPVIATFECGENVRSIAPQQYRASDADDDAVSVHARIAKPMRNVRVALSAGGRCVHEKKFRIVRPAECLILHLEKAFFQNMRGEMITFDAFGEEVREKTA